MPHDTPADLTYTKPMLAGSNVLHRESLTAAPPQVRRLVGRRDEQTILSRLIREVREGPAGAALLLGGESGAGKTALAEWCAEEAAAHDGFYCARATCEPFNAGVSYFPIETLERRLVPSGTSIQQLIRDVFGDASNELNMAIRAVDDSTDPALRRQYTMATFANSVIAKAQLAAKPLLLFLDDAERIDNASVDALTVLLSRRDEAQVLVLAAFRQDIVSAEREHPLRPLLERARRGTPGVQLLEVGALRDDDFGALIATFLNGTTNIPELFLRRLRHETEGNPLHVREVLRSLQSQGSTSDDHIIQRTDGSWDFGDGAQLWNLPQSIEDAIASRLLPLSLRERSVLEAAAVIGRGCRFEMLADLTGLTESDLLTDLDSLFARDMLNMRDSADDSEAIEFTHGKIREVVYSQLTGLRRTRLHAQVAEVLESQQDLLPSDQWELAIGWHLLKARKYDAASPHLIRAGEHLLSVQAGQEASQYFRDALGALEKSNAPDPRKLAEVRLKFGESLKLASQLDAALRTLTTVAEGTDSAFAQRWAMDHIGDILVMREQVAEAQEYYTRSEQLARQAGDQELIAEVAADLAELHMRESERLAGLDPDSAAEHDRSYKRYLDIQTATVDGSSSRAAHARSLRNRAKYARTHGQLEDAISLYEQSMSFQDQKVASHQFIIPYAKALRLVGRAPEALVQVDAVLDWSRQTGAMRSEAIARQYRGLLLMERALGSENPDSDWDLARQELNRALRLHEESGFRQGHRETCVDLFELEVQRGEVAQGLAHLQLAGLLSGADLTGSEALVEAALAQLRANGERERAARIRERLQQLRWEPSDAEMEP